MKRRMSSDEKSRRHEARSYGAHAASSIQAALRHQHEADQWRELATRAGVDAPANLHFWQRNAEHAQRDAVRYARIAGHHACEAMRLGEAGP